MAPHRPAPSRRLAPVLAFLLLTGLAAPSATGGPLGVPDAGPSASNLLLLDADGDVLAWQPIGSSTTTLHVQGVQPDASGFNLADPQGRLVGPDQASSPAGSVEFLDLALPRGTYTFLGPGAVLARFDLAAYGQGEEATFAPFRGNEGRLHHLADDVGQLCAAAPLQWAAVGPTDITLRGYDAPTPACAVRTGEQGCLMDLQAPCAWAMAWAVASQACPGSTPSDNLAGCLGRRLDPPTRASPCGESPPPAWCDLPGTLSSVVALALGLINGGIEDAQGKATCTLDDEQCIAKDYADRECPPPDPRFGVASACETMRSIAILLLGLVNGSGPDGTVEAVLGLVSNGGQPDPNEYVHAGYVVPDVDGSQAVQTEIRVGGQCNRADKHAISSWISLMTYDEQGNPAYWWQTGYDQPWQPDGSRCKQAIPFFQAKNEATDRYRDIYYASPELAPAAGTFTLAFGTVEQNPAVASGASPDCVVRLLSGKTCPTALNPPVEGSCPLEGPWNATCTTQRAMLEEFIQSAPSCPPLPGLLATSPGLPACQAAEATRAILNGASILSCEAPGALDGWVCMKPAAQQATPTMGAPTCYMYVLHNGESITGGDPVAIGPSGCYSGHSEVVYELAQDYAGDGLTAPGSLDRPSGFDQWSALSQYGWAAVDGESLSPYWGFAGTCPPYNLKAVWYNNFIGPGTLYVHTDNGPNIPPRSDGTPYCGQSNHD